MFFIGVMLLGWVSYQKLSVNLLPDLSYPKITVVTHYPGSGPEEIERFITNVLEGPLSSISGMKQIDSVSKEGLSLITLEFHWGTDMDFALLHTKEQIEGVVQNLPDDCEPPILQEMDPSASPIMTVIMKSDNRDLKKQKEAAEYIIKPRLEQLDGISRVEIRGGDEEEISVEIDPDKVKNLGITLGQVAAAIEGANFFQPGGTVKKDKLRYTIKIEGEVKTPEEIDEISITNLEGRPVLIKDVGHAFFKNKVKQGNIRFNVNSSISLMLYRAAGGNTVSATEEAEAALKSLAEEFDKDIEFRTISMEAELIVSSMDSLKFSLLLGVILSILILLLFLQNYRDPFLVAIAIPIAVLSTFVLLYLFKVSLNIMSLGGLVLGLGMFVDNSIIVLESIFRHRNEKGENLIESVVNGAKEVSGAITASTFTTISIFLPVIYLYGITGKMFKDQALTVSFSLVSSLLVAITILPALSAFRSMFSSDFVDDGLKKPEKRKLYQEIFSIAHYIVMIPFKVLGYVLYYILGAIALGFIKLFKGLGKAFNIILKPTYRVFNKVYDAFDNFYHVNLEKILNKKQFALYLCLIILVGIYLSFLGLKKELLPAPDSGKFEIRANTIPSYGFDQTDAIASGIEKQLAKIDGVDFVFTESGAVSTFTATTEDISVNSIHYIVACHTPELRPTIMDKARAILKQAELLDYTTFLEKNTLSQYLSTSGENFQLKVFYEDINNGKDAVQIILEELKKNPNLNDIKTTTTPGKPLFAIEFKQDVLDKFNISKRQVADFINQSVRGQKAGTLKQIQKNYDIFVRVPVEGIMAVRRLLSLPVNIGTNTFFLRDLVDLKERPSIKMVARESQERYFLISADARNVELDKLITQTEAELENLQLPENTRFTFAGEEEERRKAFDSLYEAIWLAVLLVYMIMAAKFENLLQPLIIMFTVPMGLIGAFLFLLISGNSLNIISGIGILVLVGIGVNDAIVKVEYSNQLRAEGYPVRKAVMTASKVRLRPILMTTFTTIMGVLPMGLMTQTGSELQRPLALVIIGGLLFTTFLTLILIPVCYEILENSKEKRMKKRESESDNEEQEQISDATIVGDVS
jgi:hydrophobic/amphiphilic exporter-1 (mainly G- bacteria), HAE1 family